MTLWRTRAKYPRIIRFEKYCLITFQNTAARTEDFVKTIKVIIFIASLDCIFKQKMNSVPVSQNIYLGRGEPKIFINKV